jgi:hypothetical protein
MNGLEVIFNLSVFISAYFYMSQGSSCRKEDGYRLNDQVQFLAEMGPLSLLTSFPDQLV